MESIRPDQEPNRPPESDGPMIERRDVLAAGLALGIGAQGWRGMNAAPTAARTGNRRPPLPTNPFTLGVASGDPMPFGVVLWTRLALDPTADGGGMPDVDYRVRFEVAEDPNMERIVRRGARRAQPKNGHAVHVDFWGLRPNRPYWYRFRVGSHLSPIGRTRTTPWWAGPNATLTFGHASCQRYSGGFYAAYADMAESDLDLVVHVGDYIYETGGSGARSDPLPESITLDQYRNRYALYKTDPDLQAAHATAPWVFTWDDHEVENNYTGLVPEVGSSTPDPVAFAARRRAAYQAYWENMPIRRRPDADGSFQIYRKLNWGNLTDLYLTDTRQYRDDQICGSGDIGPPCDFSFDPDTTVFGARQERWLGASLERSRATWTTVASSIMVAPWIIGPGDPGFFNLDQWDGYPVARQRLLDDLAAHAAGQTVVLSGDLHVAQAGSVRADPRDPESTYLGAEFTATSISTNRSDALNALLPVIVANSPDLDWADGTDRGWVKHTVQRDAWQADFRHVEDHQQLNSPVRTVRSWTLPRGGELEGN
ncbi:MAG: alkaline phosphatase [Acidimicrobiales bacterium]|nr:alkaline phosphatase [Acidimicrobiales bacterium]